MSITEVIAMVVTVIAIPISMWFMYKFIAVSNKVKEVCSGELPYKVEPEKPADDVAIPERDIKSVFENWASPEEFAAAREPKPKRAYIKRSKYWTDKRKKAAAAKARKTKRKSK